MKKTRYAHADCALREAAKNGWPAPEIVDPNDFVTCVYCKKVFNKNEVAILISKCQVFFEKKFAFFEKINKKLTSQRAGEGPLGFFAF